MLYDSIEELQLLCFYINLILTNLQFATMNILKSCLLIRLLQVVSAQSVTCNLEPGYAAPVMADGWESRLIVNGLRRPRSILFDTEGALLVVEQQTGIRHLRLADGNGTCLSVQDETTLVQDSAVSNL